MIPAFELKTQYQSLADDIENAAAEVLRGGSYILGPRVRELETRIAERVGAAHAIGVGNGTDALHLALRALQIGPGDEVITTPFTFVATTEAIGIVGATPVFADIDLATFNLDPAAVEAAVTERTKAILPVHLYGQPVQMDALRAIAKRHGLAIVEDAAQAIGATFGGEQVGTLGDVACFSFFPTKNLGCAGDGGMVTTNDPSLFERVEMLRRHGGKVKYHHSELGLNSRLDELQAAILLVKEPHLDRWTEARRTLAARYNELLADVEGVVTPVEIDGVHAVYHQYTIRVEDRDAVQQRLKDAGVGTAVYYPVPLYRQEVHADLGYASGDFPQSEEAARTALSLPMFPELTHEQQDQVVEALAKALVA